ncbi:MAG: hypoxanthine phosphoribosyltransferase [Firmicutes bacterium]|nr:hypoxanthine phosphoribosyltransferase [Bacillota bacterium]
MKNDIKEVLLTEKDIQKKLEELGKQISEDYKGKDLLLIGVLKGAVMVLTDLAKNISIPLTMDFMAVSSYGSSTESSGVVKIIKDLDESIEGKDILIVEDIIDTGLTLSYLVSNLKSRDPKSIKLFTLLDKPERRKVDLDIDYSGYSVPDAFIVGYGLDYDEKYRNLPYIATLKEEIYR